MILSGCATTRYPSAYKIEGMEVKEFKELDDERALKILALIYNVRHENWEDGIARSLTLEEYLNLIRKRKSKYIKKSGIFEIEYEKVKLSKWKDKDLVRLYDILSPKAGEYYMDFAQELSEKENAQRIVYLTAINSVSKELKKRDIAYKALSIAGQILGTLLTVALSLI